MRWNLQNNLFFAVDGPVPEPDVRTPPGAKPKVSPGPHHIRICISSCVTQGSALKKVSALPKPKKLVRNGIKLKKKRKASEDGCGF